MRDLLLYLVPVIVAALTEPLAEVLFKVNAVINKLPAWAKQIAVAAIAYGLVQLSGFLGAPADDQQALLSAGLTFLFHIGRKQSEPS